MTLIHLICDVIMLCLALRKRPTVTQSVLIREAMDNKRYGAEAIC